MKDVKINININSFTKKLMVHLHQRMIKVMVAMVGIVKTSLNVSGNGRPSAPGEAPHKQTGSLINAITFNVALDGRDVVGRYGVRRGGISRGDPDSYAKRLELGFIGTDKAGRNINQLPRPFLAPALLNNKKRIIKVLKS